MACHGRTGWPLNELSCAGRCCWSWIVAGGRRGLWCSSWCELKVVRLFKRARVVPIQIHIKTAASPHSTVVQKSAHKVRKDARHRTIFTLRAL